MPELNAQDRLCVSELSAASVVAPRESMARSCASVSEPAFPDLEKALTERLTLSALSGSMTVNVPDLDNGEFVSVRAADAQSPAPTKISGRSLVPVTVTETVAQLKVPFASRIA